MKKVITYGTFDLFHQGHINLLNRAKSLGDYLIVGVTTDNYDRGRGKLNVHRSLMERINDVREAGFADEIIIEEYEGQKLMIYSNTGLIYLPSVRIGWASSTTSKNTVRWCIWNEPKEYRAHS